MAYGGVYTGLEILAVPAVPLTMTAGVVFGTVPGIVIVSAASTAAATISFLIARYAARDRVLHCPFHLPSLVGFTQPERMTKQLTYLQHLLCVKPRGSFVWMTQALTMSSILCKVWGLKPMIEGFRLHWRLDLFPALVVHGHSSFDVCRYLSWLRRTISSRQLTKLLARMAFAWSHSSD